MHVDLPRAAGAIATGPICLRSPFSEQHPRSHRLFPLSLVPNESRYWKFQLHYQHFFASPTPYPKDLPAIKTLGLMNSP